MTPIRLPPLRYVVSGEVILIATAASFVLPGGEDIYTYFVPLGRGCFTCAFNPYYTSWLMFPLTLIPTQLLWPFVVLTSLLSILWVSTKMGTNPAVVLLAFPTLALVWLGQIDALVIAGLALAFSSRHSALRGLGLVMASVKPQMTIVPILVLLWYDRERWKTLILPLLVFAASLVIWGITWPLEWVRFVSDAKLDIDSIPLWNQASLYPYGIVFFAAIFLVKGSREQLTGALLASALAFPWFGVYAYSAFLVFWAPWWALPISYAWVVAYPLLGSAALRLAWITPLSMLIALLWPNLIGIWNRHKANSTTLASRESSSAPADDKSDV